MTANTKAELQLEDPYLPVVRPLLDGGAEGMLVPATLVEASWLLLPVIAGAGAG